MGNQPGSAGEDSGNTPQRNNSPIDPPSTMEDDDANRSPSDEEE
jgi:hypothetical protein